MPSASIKKEILCSKENLIKVVLDIENYPKFVPWCVGSKIHKKTVTLDKIEIVADLTIGKSFFKETYKSFIVYNKSLDSITVTNINGPLKHLINKWFFKKIKNSSEIDFYIEFELKSKILNLILLNQI
jgi:coenzyme Q-binding protein COQ10